MVGGPGLYLVRRNRRLVLFLRRFGHSEAIHALTVASARIGGSWRLVTLDDARIAPVGMKPHVSGALDLMNFLFEVGGLAFEIGRDLVKGAAYVAGVGLAISGITVFAATDGSAGDRLGEVLRLFGWGQSGSGFAAGAFKFFVWILVACAVVVLAVLVVGIPVMVLTPALTMIGFVEKAVHDADQLKAIRIVDAGGIAEARARLRKVARRVFSARLIVLKVDGSVWRPPVTDVAAESDAALIDVSQPTENILWEIDQLTHRNPRPCVFVAEHSRVGELHQASDATASRLRELLDGQDILVYTTDRAGIRQFTKALRVALDQRRRMHDAAASTIPSEAVRDRAELIAQTRDSSATAVEHLLLAVVEDGDSVAAMTLRCLGVPMTELRHEARRLVDRAPDGRPRSGLQLAPGTKTAYDLAFREAIELGHRHIGTEHLLLGLIREGGVAAVALDGFGVDSTAPGGTSWPSWRIGVVRTPPGYRPGPVKSLRYAAVAIVEFTVRHWRPLTQLGVIVAAVAGVLASVTSTVGSCQKTTTALFVATGIAAAIGGAAGAAFYLLARGEHETKEFLAETGLGATIAYVACCALSNGPYNFGQSCLPT